jgi:hypothetical protein
MNRKRTAILLGLAGIFALSGSARPAEDNTPPPGFTALFNGKDLTNWQGLVELPDREKVGKDGLAKAQEEANKRVLPHWSVKDGVLIYSGARAKGKPNSLQTAKDYGNFELYLDWKIDELGDSGVYLRGNPQVQIWDSDRSPGARGLDKGSGSGGLWNNQKNPNRPLKKADKPVGQWNTFHIIMKGDRVTVFLNGEKVVDNTPLENYWNRGQPLPTRGPIELQDHGDKLWFKNIYIKELPD